MLTIENEILLKEDELVIGLSFISPNLNTIKGTFQNDLLRETNKDDLIYGLGGNGDDVIYGDNPSFIYDQPITHENGTSIIFFPQQFSDDVIYGGNGNDRIVGGNGDDIIYGDSAELFAITHGSSEDVINNTIYYPYYPTVTFDDKLYGGNGDDTMYGGQGNDVLYGGNGHDTLNGNRGDDTLHGGSGDDRLNGGTGDDVLYGDAGNDILFGGSGADTFVFGKSALGSVDTVTDFDTTEGDALDFSDLLAGMDPMQAILEGFITATTTKDGNTIISFDADGNSRQNVLPGEDPVDMVVLEGVTGVSLEDMLNNGSLIL